MGENGKFDLSASGWDVLSYRAMRLPFLEPFLDKGDVILLKKSPKKSDNLFFFLKPFSWDAWLTVLVILLLGTYTLLQVEKLERERKKVRNYEQEQERVRNKSGGDSKIISRRDAIIESSVRLEDLDEIKPIRQNFARNRLFPITAVMIWFQDVNFTVSSFTAQLVIFALFFGVFLFHELYLASILDALIASKNKMRPFKYMSYNEFMLNENNRLACPFNWGSCTIDHPIKFSSSFKIKLDSGKDMDDAISLLENGKIDGLSMSYDYGLSVTARACDKIGFLPVGKNGWIEKWLGKYQAGITHQYNTAWVTRRNFEYVDEVNAAIIRLKEDGVVDKLFHKWTEDGISKPCIDKELNEKLQMGVVELSGILIIVASVSLLAFLFAKFRPKKFDTFLAEKFDIELIDS